MQNHKLWPASIIGLGVIGASAQRRGGYREIDKADEGATNAAEFAVKAQSEKKEMTYKLVSIEHAESQTLAGINYRVGRYWGLCPKAWRLSRDRQRRRRRDQRGGICGESAVREEGNDL